MKYKNNRILSFSPWPITLFLLCVVMGACVFVVTQSVQQYEGKIAKINQALLSEQQTKRVLDAEWAYLTRPQRLEELLTVKVAEKAALALQVSGMLSEAEKQDDVVEVTQPIKVTKVEKEVTPRIVQQKTVPKKTPSVIKKAKIKEIDVWPIEKKVTLSKAAQVVQSSQRSTPRVGVARPILE